MQEFSNRQHRPRLTHRPAALVALGVLLIGGGAFAATGGIAKLKSWVFRVNVNGQEATLVANDGEPASMVIQGDDGKTTTIKVMKASGDDGDHTQVDVNAVGDDSENQQQIRIVRRTGPGPEISGDGEYSLKDLGDAQPNHTWTDPAGNTVSIYVLPGDGQTVRIFRTLTDAGGDTSVHLVAAPRMEFDLGDSTPTVTSDGNGLTTIVFDNGQGERRMMKFKIAQGTNPDDLPEDGAIKIRTEDGHIQVDVNKHADQD